MFQHIFIITEQHKIASIPIHVSIEEGFRQKKRQRSSLLWGRTEFIQLRRAIYILPWTIWRIGWFHPFLHIILVSLIIFFISFWSKIASATKEYNKFCPPNSRDDLCLLLLQIILLCMYPYSWADVRSVFQASEFPKNPEPICSTELENDRMEKPFKGRRYMCNCFSAESAPEFPRKREIYELCSTPPPTPSGFTHRPPQ